MEYQAPFYVYAEGSSKGAPAWRKQHPTEISAKAEANRLFDVMDGSRAVHVLGTAYSFMPKPAEEAPKPAPVVVIKKRRTVQS